MHPMGENEDQAHEVVEAVRELTVELARTNARVLELEGKIASLERWRAYATGQK
jgi:hypothetical protein